MKKKLMFKNPKGETIYLAKVGFDWGAFWGMFFLGGLPFFLRKMNTLGWFCLVFMLAQTIGIGFEVIANEMRQESLKPWQQYSDIIVSVLISFFISVYLGIRGGKLTARHYEEEGYECITKDEALLARAKEKWEMEF